MNCKNCGMELDKDAKFCTGCGVAVETEINVGNQMQAAKESITKQMEKMMPAIEEEKKKKRFNGYYIVGTLLIIIGLCTALTAGTTISSTSFGADFYTYTYKGIVAISELLAAIHGTLGWILVALGVNINVNAKNR